MFWTLFWLFVIGLGLLNLGLYLVDELFFSGADRRRQARRRREIETLLADYYASPQYQMDQAWKARRHAGAAPLPRVQP
jgi:hypothetical protein